MRTERLIAVAPVVAALALSACGSSKDSSGSETGASNATSSSAASPAGAVSVKETEYKLDPAAGTVTLKAGTATIDVVNDGKIVHSLALEKAGPGGKDVESKTIQPGSSTTLKVKLKPGTYEWYCPIDGHKKLGMVGKITVKG